MDPSNYSPQDESDCQPKYTLADMNKIENIGAKLGRGSRAQVRLVRFTDDGSLLALKSIDLASLKDHSLIEREKGILIDEYRIQSAVTHPNVLRMYDLRFEDHYPGLGEGDFSRMTTEQLANYPGVIRGGKANMLVQLAAKGDLKRYLDMRGRLIEPEALHIVFQVAHALEHLHKQDIIHRDLKLENVLLGEHERIILSDFGWASPPGDPNRRGLCGTYDYMAPEVIKEQEHNEKIDIWSLGVLAFELIVGRTPFKAPEVEMIKSKIIEGHFTTDSVRISNEYMQLITRCLENNPNYRLSASGVLQLPVFSIIKHCYYRPKESSISSNENSPKRVPDYLDPRSQERRKTRQGTTSRRATNFAFYEGPSDPNYPQNRPFPRQASIAEEGFHHGMRSFDLDTVHKPWSQGGSAKRGFESPDNMSPMKVYPNKNFQFSLNVQPSQPNYGGSLIYHGEPLKQIHGPNGSLELASPPELQDLKDYEPTPFEVDFMDRKEGGIGQFIEFDLHTEIYDAYAYVKTKSENLIGSFFGSTQAEPPRQAVQTTAQVTQAEHQPKLPYGNQLTPGIFAQAKPPSFSDIPWEKGLSPPPPVRQERPNQLAPPTDPSKSSGGFLSFFGFGS